LHDKELYKLYSSPDIIRVRNPGGWERWKMYTKFWLENIKETKPHWRSGIGQRAVTELIWCCEHSNEQSYNIMNNLSIFLKYLQSVFLD